MRGIFHELTFQRHWRYGRWCASGRCPLLGRWAPDGGPSHAVLGSGVSAPHPLCSLIFYRTHWHCWETAAQRGTFVWTGHGCSVWPPEETSDTADSSSVPLKSETHALREQLTQLHHDQGLYIFHLGPGALWQSHSHRSAHTILTDYRCESLVRRQPGSVAGRCFEHARAHVPRDRCPPVPNPRAGTATFLLWSCLQSVAHGPFSFVSGDSGPQQQPRSVKLVWAVRRKRGPDYILFLEKKK